jgi:hypothetical protein
MIEKLPPKDMFERPDKIGEMIIHPESRATAFQIIESLGDPEGCPILVAEPQQGKTETAIPVINEFKNKAEADGSTFQIIWLCNKSDNDLKDQTQERMDKAGLWRYVQTLHHADIVKEYKTDIDTQETLIIVDECHVALGKNRPFHNFLKKFGIKYGAGKSQWDVPKDKNVYMLNISATPYAQIIRNHIDKKSFIPIRLKRSENYYGLKEISKRMIQSEAIIDRTKKSTTTWFKNRVEDFNEICKKNGVGYLLVRSMHPGPDIIENEIEKNYPNIKCKIFDNKLENLPKLYFHLKNEPFVPTILIIRGALRAGKTLPTTKYIRMAIDPPTAKSDTVTQSLVGRCCGYKTEDGHSKFDDIFPIYCNTKEREMILKFYEKSSDFEHLPGGRNSTSSHEKKTIKGCWTLVEKFEDLPEEYKSLGITKVSGWATEFKEDDAWLYSGHQRLANDDIYGGRGDNSRNIFWDLSDDDWNKRIDDYVKKGKVSIDSAKKAKDSRKKCNEKYNNPKVGSYFYYKVNTNLQEVLVPIYGGPAIKKNTMLSDAKWDEVIRIN